MATTVFGRTEKEFWQMTPRTLVAMCEEWNRSERQKAKVIGVCLWSYMNGKDPDQFLGGTEQKKATEAQMKKNAAAFF